MLYLRKSPQNYYGLVLSNERFFDIYLLDNSPGAFFADVETLDNDLNSDQQYKLRNKVL